MRLNQMLNKIFVTIKLTFAGLTLVALTGCLMTRDQLRGEAPAPARTQQRQQVVMQQEQAQQNLALQAYDDQFKDLRNRLDILENQLSQANSERTSKEELNAELDRRLKLYEEALKNLEIQILGMVKDVQDLKKKALNSSSSNKASNQAAAPSDFQVGESQFDKKQWREAILSYQSYREKNPKGNNYAEATYKIGVCFQELGLKDEARAFYSEAVSKFPKSDEAKRAQYRLKNLK